MSNTDLEPSDSSPCEREGRNFFDEFDETEEFLPPRTRLLQMLSDTGDVLEDIETRCSDLVRAIESASLSSNDAAGLKKRVWRIEDLSVKAAEKINGRHDETTA